MAILRCITATLVFAACGNGVDPMPEAKWATVAENLPTALLSGWAANENDVWVVGGDPRDNMGPIVEHYDGSSWTRLDTGERNVDLWWMTGFAGGPLFFGGSNGTILRYQNGAFEKLPTPGTRIVFGLWGATPTDLWAVGGTLASGGFVWRFDGTTWSVVPMPSDITDQGTCFKVGGIAADNVWIVATRGATFHWTGAGLDRVDVPVDESLFSVAGNRERFVTVGGDFGGLLYENSGSGWQSALSEGGPKLAGVAVSDDQAYAVGQFGAVYRRDSNGWVGEKTGLTIENLHAAFIDRAGGIWVVGGKYDSTPMSKGVLLHKGDPLQGGF